MEIKVFGILYQTTETMGGMLTFAPGGAGIGNGLPSGLNCVRGPTGGRSGELGPTPEDGMLGTHC